VVGAEVESVAATPAAVASLDQRLAVALARNVVARRRTGSAWLGAGDVTCALRTSALAETSTQTHTHTHTHTHRLALHVPSSIHVQSGPS